MCVIIAKPETVKLERAIYQEAFRVNKDGAGFAYISNRKIHIRKGYFNFKNFYSALKEHEDKMLVVHCRIQTCGFVNEDNCHPFLIEIPDTPYSYIVAHNGTLKWPSTKEKSDTRHFVEELLTPLFTKNPEILDEPWCRWMLQEAVGGNKLVIVRYNKDTNLYTTHIINEALGVKDKGCWFSNSSWRPWSYYQQQNRVHGGMGCYSGDDDWEQEHFALEAQVEFLEYRAKFCGWFWVPAAELWKKSSGETRTSADMQKEIVAEYEKERERRHKMVTAPIQPGSVRQPPVVHQVPGPLPAHKICSVLFKPSKSNPGVYIGTDDKVYSEKEVERIIGRKVTDEEKKSDGKDATMTIAGFFVKPPGPMPKNPDDDLLTEEEWKKKYGEAVPFRPNGKEITVPREPGIVPADGLGHLTDEECKALVKLAAECMKSAKADMKGKSNLLKVQWLRDFVVETYPAAKQLAPLALDAWILKSIELDSSGNLAAEKKALEIPDNIGNS